ncbi:RNA polymerase sigma factor [Aquimarina algicola]|uniref:RNA polymerase sigma factor n=1 Tax=Aquimarina algicola TaxID=2589995 RepID=A0A504J853_9FLAO|nr:RNA polymerase sigma factor [Aquimarina algicola]TPN84702.1 RNA polymerase sigma factor [Aquimarina algicola]
MDHQTDQYYITKTLKGEINAFSTLVERYQTFVYTIAYRVVKNKEIAEEVAQDSFVKAYESLNTYREEAKFSTWLYTIVYRKSLDIIKAGKKKMIFESLGEIQENKISFIDDALYQLQVKERKKVISDSIMKLQEDEAIIITLYYFEEKNIREIAAIIDLTLDNVKIKLYRSRKKLYSILKHYLSPEICDKNGRAI